MAHDEALRRDLGHTDPTTSTTPGGGDMPHARDDELRRDMDESRQRIGETVSEIERRVRPQHIIARRRRAVRRRLTDWKDSVFGNDDTGYPEYPGWAANWDSYSGTDPRHGADEGILDRGRRRGTEAAHAVEGAPRALRRQTRGNPMAAGAIALGVGWLIGSILPESRRERELAARAEPQLAHSMAAARHQAEDLSHSVQDTAREAAQHVKEAGREAVEDLSDRGKEAASSVRDRS
jgi:hypothetical protein